MSFPVRQPAGGEGPPPRRERAPEAPPASLGFTVLLSDPHLISTGETGLILFQYHF